jgi:uronate dehydrogenase
MTVNIDFSDHMDARNLDDMAEAELPLVCTTRVLRARPDSPAKAILITGAAGVVGSIAANRLQKDFRLIALDQVAPSDSELYEEIHVGNLNDPRFVQSAAAHADYILHVAGGVSNGWQGLLDSEICGTRNVLNAALGQRTRRVILASSNHIVGWHELDRISDRSDRKYEWTETIRPDGVYGASKAFVEALGRAAAEYAGLPVSVLRIGTMRLDDSPALLGNDPSFAYLGNPDDVVARMKRTWLYHDDFESILREELGAEETFRTRFAVSGEDSPWTTEVLSWSR